MDTSKTYIKQCEEAEEIQDILWGNRGDYFYKRDGIGYGLWLVCKVEHGSLWCSGQRMNEAPFNGKLVQFMTPESYIWLPRQDQLQEMVSHGKPISLVDDLNYFCLPMDRLGTMPHKRAVEEAQKHENYIASFTSMEQLWLAFVMKEKHSKVWDGEKWLKE